MAKKIIIYYQIIGCVAGFILVFLTNIIVQFYLPSLVFLLFTLFGLYASILFLKHDKYKLFEWLQIIQTFGFCLFGYFFYLHAGLFARLVIGYIDSEINWEFQLRLPSFTLTHIDNYNNIILYFNFVPILILYLLIRQRKNQQWTHDQD